MQSRRSVSVEDFTPGVIHDIVIRPLTKWADERGWLAEIFRADELEPEFYPAMAYISVTEPGLTRGPHEHRAQSDLFCFPGPSTFKIRMWDNREESASCGRVMTLHAGASEPRVIIIPRGVVHAYRNVGTEAGLIINCPNRLYRGRGRREEVDEIRYEDDPETIFRMDD